jgi:glucosamine-6-phosphate deaminase
MSDFSLQELYTWCKVPYEQLVNHPQLRTPFRLCRNSAEMGALMARELVDEIQEHNQRGETTRAILPCGPACWYEPFTDLVNREKVNLNKLVVFHMDECLDWQNRELPRDHPYSFRGFMERFFYAPVEADHAVRPENRHWLNAHNVEEIWEKIRSAPIDITYGGWGQDGHIAYNQTRRHPYSQISLAELRTSSIRVQENNLDTILALAQRTFGAAYQFVPPMSVTLGIQECLSARKVRLFSDTGSWKQTALRVALFGSVTTEYPITLLQEHPDALITATIETATHPISQHPEWNLGISEA